MNTRFEAGLHRITTGGNSGVCLDEVSVAAETSIISDLRTSLPSYPTYFWRDRGEPRKPRQAIYILYLEPLFIEMGETSYWS